MQQADLARCRDCAHYKQTSVFELCMHAASTYKIAEDLSQHTIGHMRSIGACRQEAVLFSATGEITPPHVAAVLPFAPSMPPACQS